MKIQNHSNFFSASEQLPNADSFQHLSMHETTHKTAPHRKIQRQPTSNKVAAQIRKTIDVLRSCGFKNLAENVAKIYRDTARDRFVISVVGEFSKGKSTFLNNLLNGAPMLPVENLPTTAILTRIRYAASPKMAVFDDKGNRLSLMDVRPESWRGLTANNFGESQPKGCVFVGIPSEWLAKQNMEFIDTPGAGDLSKEREKVIGDALARTDGAIITVSATAALSLTEKTFIQQRIISQKTPYVALIVNKLDLVSLKERNGIIKHIKDVLSLNKMDIPVFIPYDIEMPDDTYASIIGLQNIKSEIESWVSSPERQQRTDLWVKARTLQVVSMALDILSEQSKLLNQEDEKRMATIAKQKLALDKLSLEWSDLSLKLQEKSNKCYEKFLEKVDEYQNGIIEKLQYEAAHSNNPSKWWKEDYPYRLKVELANMSIALENVVVKQATSDARWFNTLLEQKFKELIQVGEVSVTDKGEFTAVTSEKQIEFEDISKQLNMRKVGTVALSIASYFLLSATGAGLGILATMGIGTGGAILTDSFFKKKLEEQRNEVKSALAADIPTIVVKATAQSEQRVLALYNQMLRESQTKMESWIKTQEQVIATSNVSDVEQQRDKIQSNTASLKAIADALN